VQVQPEACLTAQLQPPLPACRLPGSAPLTREAMKGGKPPRLPQLQARRLLPRW